MTAADDTRTEIAAVLGEHEQRQKLIAGRWMLVCSCGEWVTDFEFDPRAEEQDELHRAHVSLVLAEYVATKQAESLREAASCPIPDGFMNVKRWLRDRADWIAP